MRATFMVYEIILAIRRAAQRVGLTARQTQAIFCDNGMRLLEAVRRLCGAGYAAGGYPCSSPARRTSASASSLEPATAQKNRRSGSNPRHRSLSSSARSASPPCPGP